MTVHQRGPKALERSRLRAPQLVREPEERCNFCGGLAATVLVAAGPDGGGAMICPSCVDRAARQLFPPRGGDAA